MLRISGGRSRNRKGGFTRRRMMYMWRRVGVLVVASIRTALHAPKTTRAKTAK